MNTQGTTPTLQPHVDRYLRGRRARGEIAVRTYRTHHEHLLEFARVHGGRRVDQLGPKAIERYLEHIGRHAPSTRRSRLSTVKGFCRWLVEQGLLAQDPTEKLRPIKQPRSVPRALNVRQVSKLLDVLPDLRAQTIVWLMLGMGLRSVEVERLGFSDYNPDAGTLTVLGKGGHVRVLPVPPEVTVVLERYLDQTGRYGGPMIRRYDKPWLPLGTTTIWRYMARWMREAGIKGRPFDGVAPHALRHTAASDVLDKSGDLRIVQAMLGHANIATTSIYLRRARLEDMRDAMSGRSYREANGPEDEPGEGDDDPDKVGVSIHAPPEGAAA